MDNRRVSSQQAGFQFHILGCIVFTRAVFHSFRLFDLCMEVDSHGYEVQVCLQTLWDIIQPLGTVNHG